MEKNIIEHLYPGKVEKVEVAPTLQKVTSEATGRFTTSSTAKRHRIKSLREKFLGWVISWMLPGFHLVINPPKGRKSPRRNKKEV